MKKTISMVLVLSAACALSGCAGGSGTSTTAAETTAAETTAAETSAEETTTAPEAEETTDSAEANAEVLSYSDYMAAELDSDNNPGLCTGKAVLVGGSGYSLCPGSGRRLLHLQHGLHRRRI